MDTPREIELKFEIEPKDLDKLRALAPLNAPDNGVKQLESVYYDTDDRRLRGAGLALRVRRDGNRRLQTVKTYDGEGLFDRGEWECEIGGDEPDLEAVGRTPAGAVLNGDLNALHPLFATRFRRTLHKLKGRGSEIELALDEGEVDAGERSAPLLEVELELKRGPPAALFAAARKLSKGAPLHLSLMGKAERGYSLADGQAAEAQKAAPLALPPDIAAAEAFRRIGRTCLAQITENARVLRHTRNLEALHQMRVGVRRLRAAISMFKDVVAEGTTEAIKGELKWITGELGPARNLDVFLSGTFEPAAKRDADRKGMAELGEALRGVHAAAYDRAVAAAESDRFRSLVLETAAWIETGGWAEGEAAGRPARKAAGEALSKLRRRIVKRGEGIAHLDAEARHEIRIDGKKLRYGVEFFAGLFPGAKAEKRREVFAKALKSFQEVLGELNDIATAKQTAREAVKAAGVASRHAALAADLAVEGRASEARRRLKAAGKLHAELAEAKPFW